MLSSCGPISMTDYTENRPLRPLYGWRASSLDSWPVGTVSDVCDSKAWQTDDWMSGSRVRLVPRIFGSANRGIATRIIMLLI